MTGQGVSGVGGRAGGPRIVAHTLSYQPWRRIGAELATHALLTVLADAGWRVIVTPHDTKDHSGWETAEIDGVHVVPPELAERTRPDVVLAHAGFFLRAREHADRHGAPLVLSGHGGPPGWLAAQCDSSRAALLLANSQTMAYGLARTGLPVQLCRPPVWTPEDFGRRPTGDAVTLVNSTEGKGVDVLIHLAQAMPHQRFVAVRGGYGEQADLSHLPNVEVVPHGTPMRQVWDQTRVLIMPSREESWGMAAVEAMGNGIPVVGSAIPGLSEALGDDMPKVDPRNYAGWRTAVADALGSMWSRWHRAALRRAAELDPAPDLLATMEAITALTGEGPMGTTQRYRNIRTGDEVEVDPDSFIGRRLAGTPLIWHRVECPVDADPRGPSGSPGSDGENPADPAEPGTLSADPGLHIPDPVPQPAHGAPREAWVEYAVSLGCDRAAAKRATRSALIALYADPRR